MQRFARVADQKVVEILQIPQGLSVADAFHPDVAEGLVAVSEDVEANWIYEGGAFFAPPAPQPDVIDLIAYAANKRWSIENGGITIAGVPIATDDRSKIMIMGARVAAEANADWTTVWHGADGATYPINAAAMIAINDAVEAHVNATFAVFAQVKADIEAGEITTTAEIDAAFD